MTVAAAKVMLLSLLRDRGALALAFLLPPAMFVVFAAIFSNTGDDAIDLRVGFAAQVPAPELRDALADAPGPALRLYESAEALRLAVAEGALDGGILVEGDLSDLATPPVAVLVDPGKTMAGAVLEGRVSEALGDAMPALMIERQVQGLAGLTGPLTASQAARVEAVLAAPPEGTAPGLVTRRPVREAGTTDPTVTYYAGAITVMFLLFGSTQAASSLIDERDSGILDRFAAGPGGVAAAVMGKALFLTALGALQAAVVFAVAAIAYGVPVAAHLPQWALATVMVSAAAAGLGLLIAAACRSRAQAAAVSTFLILVASAIGGSMVPRFLMPDWLREFGVVSPNAWAVDLYHGLLYRGRDLAELWAPAAALCALGLLGTWAAVILSRRRMLL